MELLTRKEAAARLGVTVVTLDAYRTAGHLAYIQDKPNGKVWITEEALESFWPERHIRPALALRAEGGTMDDKRKLALVEDIITGVVCSEVWNQEQMENPEIIAVIVKLDEVLAEVRPYIPEELAAKLEQAVYEYTGAYERGAILHGIHIADTLREVAARPSDYSKIITNTLKEAQKS